jgi:hypothetical protein
MIQGRQQQAASTSARETERTEALGIDAVSTGKHLQRHEIIGEHRAGKRLPQRTGGLGNGLLVQSRRKIKPFVLGWTQTLLPPQSVLGVDEGSEPWRGAGQVKSSASPGEGVVHEYGVTLTSQIVSRSPTRVVLITKPDGPRGRVGTEVDKLLSANRPHAAVTVHAEYAGQAPPYTCWSQQPCRRIGPVTHRPAKATDQDSVLTPTSVIEHCWAAAQSSQAEQPT